MDIEKQIEYWRDGSSEDWDVALKLIADDKIRHGLFFAHLALEKALKAHVCQYTKDVAPRIHNLVRLQRFSGLAMKSEFLDVLADLNQFNIEGRYPESHIPLPTRDEVRVYLKRAGELLTWLMNQF